MRTIDIGTLRLEPQTVAHADEMFAALSDPAIYEYENEPPVSLEWLRNRFARLESRQSTDGRQQWLNWVIRPPTGELIGYVQATVLPDQSALIAYELNSRHWGRGLAFAATQGMMTELTEQYGVSSFAAVLKEKNWRSRRLLERLGFIQASPAACVNRSIDPGELLMLHKPGCVRRSNSSACCHADENARVISVLYGGRYLYDNRA